MRLPTRPLVLLALLAAPAAAQFESARPLIAEDRSEPIPGIPTNDLWTHEEWIGIGGDFFGTDEDGWSDLIVHDRISWSTDRSEYSGFLDGRSMALGNGRYLVERDLSGGTTYCELVETHGRELRLFGFHTTPGSDFEVHLRARGVGMTQHEDDGLTTAWDAIGGKREPGYYVNGHADDVLDALRTLDLEDLVDERYRRPTHEEWGHIWNVFELRRWYDQAHSDLLELEGAFDRLSLLGQLHLVHEYAWKARWGDLAALNFLEFETYPFAGLVPSRLERLFERSVSLIEQADERMEVRMAWLAEQIEVLEHREKVVDPDDPFDWVSRPSPGAVLQVHVKVTTQDGTVLEDTRAMGEPAVMPLMGDVPEGIQYALRILGYEERMTVRIPAELAFGEQYGDVDVDLEIVDTLPNRRHRPALDGIAFIEIGSVDAEETPSGLRYRELNPGEGPTPTRGQEVEIGLAAWNAMGQTLNQPGAVTIEVGAPELMAGITEALLSMPVGSERVLFIPPHLADQDPSRAGLAQCVVVKLIAIVE